MNLDEFFTNVERTMRAKFLESGIVSHPGDKGENREEILADFLREHLPNRYGVTKGQILSQSGSLSHSADIVIFDALNCPVLYSGRTAILPIEGVYGIVEVKSRLTKRELIDAMRKIERFKRMAPRELSVIKTRHHVTVERSSRPFGIVFGYELGDGSLASTTKNYTATHTLIHDVNFFTNLVCVAGVGLVHYREADVATAQYRDLLDTDEFVDLIMLHEKRRVNDEPQPDVFYGITEDPAAELSFGRFFVDLLIMLSRMKVNVPDLGRYLDPDADHMIIRE